MLSGLQSPLVRIHNCRYYILIISKARRKGKLADQLFFFRLEKFLSWKTLRRFVLISHWLEVGHMATLKSFMIVGMGLPWTNHYFLLGSAPPSWFTKTSFQVLLRRKEYNEGWRYCLFLKKSCRIASPIPFLCQNKPVLRCRLNLEDRAGSYFWILCLLPLL